LLPSSRVLPRPGAAERCLPALVAAVPPGAARLWREIEAQLAAFAAMGLPRIWTGT